MPGKKGNKNASKHTIYSSFIAVVDSDELAAMPKNNFVNELDLARAQVVVRLNKRNAATDPDLEIKYDMGARAYLQMIINAIIENTTHRETETMRFTSLAEAMLSENDRQKWKR